MNKYVIMMSGMLRYQQSSSTKDSLWQHLHHTIQYGYTCKKQCGRVSLNTVTTVQSSRNNWKKDSFFMDAWSWKYAQIPWVLDIIIDTKIWEWRSPWHYPSTWQHVSFCDIAMQPSQVVACL